MIPHEISELSLTKRSRNLIISHSKVKSEYFVALSQSYLKPPYEIKTADSNRMAG